MILQVHDELLFDCDKDEIDIIKEIIRDKMEHVLTLKVTLKVDIAYGNNWYEAKEKYRVHSMFFLFNKVKIWYIGYSRRLVRCSI